MVQMASELHGFLLLHGLTQARLMQACEGGHMESEVQPISTGSPKIWPFNKTECTINVSLLTNKFTSLISFPSVTWFASAHHDSKRKLIFDCTFSILNTRLDMQTWIQAFAIETSLFARTITISNAPWLLNNWFWD